MIAEIRASNLYGQKKVPDLLFDNRSEVFFGAHLLIYYRIINPAPFLFALFQPGLEFCDLLLLQLNDTRQDRDDVYSAKPGAVRTGD